VQHDVESRREDAKKMLYVLPQSLLKAVERALLESQRVEVRGNEEREAGIDSVYQKIKQSSGITIHSERKLTGRPLSSDNIHIHRRLVLDVKIMEASRTPREDVVAPRVLIADDLNHNRSPPIPALVRPRPRLRAREPVPVRAPRQSGNPRSALRERIFSISGGVGGRR